MRRVRQRHHGLVKESIREGMPYWSMTAIRALHSLFPKLIGMHRVDQYSNGEENGGGDQRGPCGDDSQLPHGTFLSGQRRTGGAALAHSDNLPCPSTPLNSVLGG